MLYGFVAARYAFPAAVRVWSWVRAADATAVGVVDGCALPEAPGEAPTWLGWGDPERSPHAATSTAININRFIPARPYLNVRPSAVTVGLQPNFVQQPTPTA
jgi:hypothetical protein